MIELFTSQGCSSCPPADKLAGELARDPSLVVMSLPIDYWDYLGWKDTLAIPGHTKRQRAYSKSRGDREVYTPQVVVNGTTHVLGSDKDAIEHAIAQTRKQPGTLSLAVSLSVTGEQISDHGAGRQGRRDQGEIWLCPITKNVPVTIGRGENSGHTITYHNVVRQLDQARRLDRRGAHLHGAAARCDRRRRRRGRGGGAGRQQGSAGHHAGRDGRVAAVALRKHSEDTSGKKGRREPALRTLGD